MEIIYPSSKPKQHRWLRWVGLQEPPVEDSTWVPIVRGLHVTDYATHTSRTGERLVRLLDAAGIVAQRRSYEEANMPGSLTGGGGVYPRIAVLVQHKDQERAVEVARELDRTLAQERHQLEIAQPALDRVLEAEALKYAPPPV